MMDTGRAASSRKVPAGILLLMPFFMATILLSNFAAGSVLDTAFIFFLITLASLVALLIVWAARIPTFQFFASLDDNKDGRKRGFRVHDIVYIFIGLGGLLLAAFVITPLIPGSVGILIALTVGGLILGVVLFKSGTFITVWLSHALYNILAYVLATFSLIQLSTSPIRVPLLELQEGFVSQTSKEIVWQVFSVSLGEELMKWSFSIGLAILLFNNANTKRSMKITYVIAVISWSLLHSVISYPVDI